MAESLLDLKTAAAEERPTINIDGTAYKMALVSDLDIKTLAKITAIGKRMSSLDEGTDLSEQEAAEISKRLHDFVPLILKDAPAATLDALGDMQRLEIVRVFTEAAAAGRGRVPPAKTPTSKEASRT